MNTETFIVHTGARYPQFPYTQADDELAAGLRALWGAWGKDPDNPFGDWVPPGGRVVIKPNWVRDFHPDGHGLECLVTHPALIAHAIEWAATALQGRGSIIIGDSPLQDTAFANLMKLTGMDRLLEHARQRHPGIDIAIEDWRLTLLDRRGTDRAAIAAAKQFQRSNYEDRLANNYRLVDLGRGSFLEEVSDYADGFRVTTYDPSMMVRHHHHGKHEYLITNRIFGADLFVNLPKMKTHMRAGLTGGLKNLVGINGHKEYLPHHTRGSYFEGGDNYCNSNRFVRSFESTYDAYWVRRRQLRIAARAYYSVLLQLRWKAAQWTGGDAFLGGAWCGNDTVWRMTMDLNHILHFNPDSPHHAVTIVDGLVAGEGMGPLRPTPKPAGLLIAGHNPAYVDATIGRIMGYNLARIPTVYHAIYNRQSQFAGPDLGKFRVVSVAAGRTPEVVPFYGIKTDWFVKPRNWERADVPISPQRVAGKRSAEPMLTLAGADDA